MALIPEVWVAQMLLEKFLPDGSWVNRSLDMSELVNYDKINFAEAGADPDVLRNNSTYPVPAVERSDTALELPLDTWDTKNTVVRNLEQKQLSYNKMESVVRGHRRALSRLIQQDASYYWCPDSDTAQTPIIESTGPVVNGKRELALEDLSKMQEKFDEIVEEDGRVMVANPAAKHHIRKQDIDLFKAFSMVGSGKPVDMFGFDIGTSQYLPVYTAAKNKRAYGHTPTASDRKVLALFYHDQYVMRALGTTDVFQRTKDPEHRGDMLGYQQRGILRALKQRNIGVIIEGVE